MPSSFRSVSFNTTAGSTGLIVNAPAGLAEGDFMFAFIAWRGNLSNVVDPSGGSEWVQDSLFPTGSVSLVVKRYAKIAGPTEPNTYSWSWSSPSLPAVAVIAAYSSLDHGGIGAGRNSVNGQTLFPITEAYANNPQPTSSVTQVTPFLYERRNATLYRSLFFWATYDAVSISTISPELTQRAFVSVGGGPSVYVGDEVIDTSPNPYATLTGRQATFAPQVPAAWVGRYLIRDSPFSSSASVTADPIPATTEGASEGFADRSLDYQHVEQAAVGAQNVDASPAFSEPSPAMCSPGPSADWQQTTNDAYAPVDQVFDGLFPGDQPTVNIILEEGW